MLLYDRAWLGVSVQVWWCVCIVYSHRVIKGLHNVKGHFMALVCLCLCSNLNLSSHSLGAFAVWGFSVFFVAFISFYIYSECWWYKSCVFAVYAVGSNHWFPISTFMHIVHEIISTYFFSPSEKKKVEATAKKKWSE